MEATIAIPTIKADVDFLGGNRQTRFMDEFMHAADMIEPGKKYVCYEQYSIECSEISMLEDFCGKFARAHNDAGGHAVFVGIRSIDGKKPEKPLVWFAEGVHSLSMLQDGKHGWGLFKDILTQLGYEATTDDRMRVISIN